MNNERGFKQVIHVALAADERYYHGLLACVVSILHSSKEGSFRFWILDGGLSPAAWTELKELGQRFQNLLGIDPLYFNADQFKHCRPIYYGSHLAYARLVLPECIEADRIIYVDADMLVLRPLEELWNLDIGDCSAAAVRDICMKSLANDCPFLKPSEIPEDAPYFNSGLMLINLELWRKEDILQKATVCLQEHPDVKYHDQTVLNYLLRNRVHFLDPSWNMLAGFIGDPRFGNDLQHVLHYTTKTKPWMAFVYHNGPAYLFYRYWTDVVRPGENPFHAFHLRISWCMAYLRNASPAANIIYLRCKLLFAKPENRTRILRSIVLWNNSASKRKYKRSWNKTAIYRTGLWRKLWK